MDAAAGCFEGEEAGTWLLCWGFRACLRTDRRGIVFTLEVECQAKYKVGAGRPYRLCVLLCARMFIAYLVPCRHTALV